MSTDTTLRQILTPAQYAQLQERNRHLRGALRKELVHLLAVGATTFIVALLAAAALLGVIGS